MRLRRRKQPVIPRCWFQDEDGTYYRNYPLASAERDKAIRLGYGALADSLIAEAHDILCEGSTRKAGLEPGEVVVQPAPFREAYPDRPGLWVLDDWDAAVASRVQEPPEGLGGRSASPRRGR